MKKIVSIIFLLLFLVGCSSDEYLEKVDIEDSPLQYNYEIHYEFESLTLKMYEIKDQKWSYVEEQTYYKNSEKDMLGLDFADNKELTVYMGNYIDDISTQYSYQTQMERFAKGEVASRDRINIKNDVETPFLAYWAYTENSQYEVTTHSETLGNDFLDYEVECDGGFLMTLTFH